MRDFAGPDNWESELDPDLEMAKRYAYRDAELWPDMTLAEWRQRIEARLNNGPNYGKLSCWEEAHAAMQKWRTALRELAADAAPTEVYALAPADALNFLGY